MPFFIFIKKPCSWEGHRRRIRLSLNFSIGTKWDKSWSRAALYVSRSNIPQASNQDYYNQCQSQISHGQCDYGFYSKLPTSKGYVVILVVVDWFTKSSHFCALKQGFTASQVADVLVQNVNKLHGFPHSILTDKEPIFLSKFWNQLMQCSGTKVLHTTTYHPECDGQSERNTPSITKLREGVFCSC